MNTFKSIVLYILSVAAAFMAGMLGHESMYRRAEDKRRICDRCWYKKDHQNYQIYRDRIRPDYRSYRDDESEETGDDQ